MHRKMLRICLMLAAALLIALSAIVPASALDDTYRFDEFAMSVKVPKNYNVITRETDRSDEVFTALGLDYDETLTAFRAADIYLRAYDPEGIFQLSLTVTSDEHSKTINNYSDLSDSDRRTIAETLTADPAVSTAVEIKHGGNIFFDTSRTAALDGETLYINQCNTIINGLQIDITLQKPKEEILADESRTLTNLAASLTFDSITYRYTGPVFDWWRLLLWAVILVVLSVAISLLYKRQNAAKHRRLEERRSRRAAAAAENADDVGEDIPLYEQLLTFEEELGYQTEEQFSSRSETDLDTFDISVMEKDPSKGVRYFEDGGDSIDDKVGYFETYFKEPTETHSGIGRLMSTAGAYIMIALRHIGYFFRNLFRSITGKGK